MSNILPSEIEVTLIVPIFNEKTCIVSFVQEVVNTVKIPFQLCLIYDHAEDNTLEKKSEVLSINPSALFIQNKYGNGVINAFKTGFNIANTRYIIAIMADLSDTPETINDLYRKINDGYDLVVASRYCKGGAKVGGPKMKYYLSKFANLSLHWLTKIPTHDMTNAFIIHKKELLNTLDLRSTGGFEITLEIIAKSYILGAKITEIPTINRDREHGISKFKLFNWIFKYLYWYLFILFYSFTRKINLLLSR